MRLAAPRDPIAWFRAWFREASRRETRLPEAMSLATAGRGGGPSTRMVLLKGVAERGFEFFTNRRSSKAAEISRNGRVALLFHWKSLDRQVRIEGRAVALGAAECDRYWATRPRGSQIGAWASDQSRPLSSRAALERKYRALAARFAEGPVPRPAHWGGYRVVPARIEFWPGRKNRLHDRIEFRRVRGRWSARRLQP